MTIVSTMASQAWKQELPFVKDEYKRVAKAAKIQHNKLYPKEDLEISKKRWRVFSHKPVMETTGNSLTQSLDKKFEPVNSSIHSKLINYTEPYDQIPPLEEEFQVQSIIIPDENSFNQWSGIIKNREFPLFPYLSSEEISWYDSSEITNFLTERYESQSLLDASLI
ncbi:hypothetical protein G9A89_010648 [Geosiphon pyriformis]|nr:hypothetical protein G9A89_010648 [Geosiphon pyriformis]